MAQTTIGVIERKIGSDKIGYIEIDCFINENYTFSNSATDIPVEDGDNITDNVTENADQTSISGFIGNAEYAAANGGLKRFEKTDQIPQDGSDPMQRIKAAYQELRRIKSARQPVDVTMGLETFHNMIITDFGIDRDASNGKSLPFTMSFKKIKVIKSEKTKVNVAKESPASAATADQTASTAEQGKAATSTPNDATEKAQWQRNVQEGKITPADYEREYGVPYPQ